MNDGPITKFLLSREGSARQAELRNWNAGLQRHNIVAQSDVTLEEASGVTERKKKEICDLLM